MRYQSPSRHACTNTLWSEALELDKGVALFVLPKFSSFNLTAVVEPLHAAGRLTDETDFSFDLFSPAGGPVTSAGNVLTLGTREIAGVIPRRLLVVLFSDEPSIGLAPLVERTVSAWAAAGSQIILVGDSLQADTMMCGTELRSAVIRALDRRASAMGMTAELLASEGGLAAIDNILVYIARTGGIHVAHRAGGELAHPWHVGAGCFGNFERALRQFFPWTASILDELSRTGPRCRKRRLAAAFGVGERQLERLARRHLHMTPMQLVRMIRLYRAHECMLRSNISIADLARDAGFSSASHFSKCYKRQFGQPPRAARGLEFV